MKHAAFLLAGLMLAGCDGLSGQTLPDGVTADEVALFRTAVTEAGCSVATETQAEFVETRTGFEEAKLAIIAQYLTFAGESEPLATGFRLTSGTCANA